MKMTIKKHDKRLLGLFKPEVLEALKLNHFNGRLIISWENGEIRSCRLSSSLAFSKYKNREDEWEDDFWR